MKNIEHDTDSEEMLKKSHVIFNAVILNMMSYIQLKVSSSENPK